MEIGTSGTHSLLVNEVRIEVVCRLCPTFIKNVIDILVMKFKFPENGKNPSITKFINTLKLMKIK